MEVRAGTAACEESSSFDESGFSAAVAAVTAAFGDKTRREIYLFAREEGGVTASQVAAHFALHPNVARHHLDKLAAGGYLEVGLAAASGSGVGRPSKIYRVTDAAELPSFPARQDDLLVTLLARTLALLDPDQAEAVAEQVGFDYGRELASQMSPGDRERSIKSSLAAVAGALTAHGFAAHAEARGASLAIISEHCPFGDAAQAHPVICAVDRGIVRGMLQVLSGKRVEIMTSSRARGDDACTAVL
jgi:predicted ArsR family transcriptional regulator